VIDRAPSQRCPAVARARSAAQNLSRLCLFILLCALLCAALLWPAQPALADFTQNGPKLNGSDAVGSAEQGFSVALSADGHTAIVGAPLDNAGAGAALVFTRSGGAWSQQGVKLTGNDATGAAQQGWSVALSADGNTAIVGGPDDNNDAGAVWVFTRSGGVWSQQGAKLTGSGAVGGAEQGYSVALSADGNTAIVGGWADNSSLGAAWVFTRSGGAWSQQGAMLTGSGASDTANIMQGFAVALSGDGNTAIVGGPNDHDGVGAAWVFTRSGSMWSQQGAKLVGSGGTASPQQGFSVALSGDGNTAIVGGPGDDTTTVGNGAVWMFTRSGTTWSQQAKVAGTSGLNPGQGFSVALAGGGNTAIVGGPSDNANTGAAWVFTRSGATWTQQGNKLIGTGAVGAASQAASVALSCNTAMVGGIGDNDFVGAAWVFVAPPTATHDFNADCLSDIVWYNTTGGQVVTWLVNGTSVIGGGSPGSAGSPWAIVGQRDFNGDGTNDILWRNGTTGQLLIWFLNGSSVIGGGSPGGAASPWAVAGTGDFNGDGFGDVLWYNTNTGQVVIWLLNGTSVIGGGSPGTAASPWTIAGTGDFNGDGMSDILWYNTSTGQVLVWLLNGTSVIGSGSPGAAASPWTIAGTGDFNGDGMSDVLWLNSTTGQALIWLLSGTSVIGGGSPGSAASPWTIAETGDFNGDSKSDILWYHGTSGQLVVWLIDGTSLIGGGSPGSAVSPWLVQGMNAD
jgi:lipocalin